MDKTKFLTVNLNTVITGVATLLLAGGLKNGWDLNKAQVEFKFTQDAMMQTLKDIVPRSELDTRFRGQDKDILELRSRVSQVELEVIKIRDRK